MNILLTSAGRRAYIVDYFKGCPGVEKVYASNSLYTIALKRADGYFITPLIYDKEYIPSIISFCKEYKITVVLSLFDIDLLVLARNESVFKANGITLILAPADFVEVCNDKYKSYKLCKELGINTPKTYLHRDDVISAIKSGEFSYPIIIKPRWGMASLGVYKVDGDEELFVFSKKCKNDIFNSYLKYESAMTPDESVIYQEIMRGEEFGLDVLNDLNGIYVKTFAKQKVAMRSGETDLGRTVSSEPFEEMARLLSKNSKHKGILSVDCFNTEKGIFLIEMDCRISGHYPLAYLAGFNYPRQLVEWLNGNETNPELLKFEENLMIVKDLVPTVLCKVEDKLKWGGGNIPL